MCLNRNMPIAWILIVIGSLYSTVGHGEDFLEGTFVIRDEVRTASLEQCRVNVTITNLSGTAIRSVSAVLVSDLDSVEPIASYLEPLQFAASTSVVIEQTVTLRAGELGQWWSGIAKPYLMIEFVTDDGKLVRRHIALEREENL